MKKLLFIALSALLFVSCGDNNTPQLPSNSYFSVGEDKTIQFSPGLLEYNTVKQTYCFASSQVVIKASDDCINQFVWGHGEDPLFHSSDPEDYATFNDWGNYPIESYLPGTWYTLSADEWKYLLNSRPNHRNLIALAQVDNIKGYILLPDNWVEVKDIPLKKGLHEDNPDYLMYSKYSTTFKDANDLSIEQWKKLEYAGAIFIPTTEEHEAAFWTTNPSFLFTLTPVIPLIATIPDAYRWAKSYVRLVKDYELPEQE